MELWIFFARGIHAFVSSSVLRFYILLCFWHLLCANRISNQSHELCIVLIKSHAPPELALSDYTLQHVDLKIHTMKFSIISAFNCCIIWESAVLYYSNFPSSSSSQTGIILGLAKYKLSVIINDGARTDEGKNSITRRAWRRCFAFWRIHKRHKKLLWALKMRGDKEGNSDQNVVGCMRRRHN